MSSADGGMILSRSSEAFLIRLDTWSKIIDLIGGKYTMTPKEKKVIDGLKIALSILERSKKDYTYYCTKDGDLSRIGIDTFLAKTVKELSSLVGRVDREARVKVKEEEKKKKVNDEKKKKKKGK